MTVGIETVVKIGGGLLAHPDHFDAVLRAIDVAAREHRLLLVPGGGPFADAVREVDRRFGLSAAAAHWMAVLAMDQFGQLVATRLARGVLVADRHEIDTTLEGDHVPVLAPSRWLRESDPLPHTWAVTSDSIAAWVAGEVGARGLVLVKPPGATGSELVDAYFPRALAAHVRPVIVSADRGDVLHSALRGRFERA